MTAPAAIPLEPDARVYVAGHGGLAGSAIWRWLENRGFAHPLGRRSSELDLRERPAVFQFFRDQAPDVVVLAAARVGGILANAAHPVDYLSHNLQIQLNVLDAAREFGVQRLLFVGSSAAYPKDAVSPIGEDVLLSGPPEAAHAGYALAKLTGVQYVRSMQGQGRDWVSVLPTNIYGPHDNFHARWSHVVPALIRKFHEAVLSSADHVEIWGSGTARREFLHSSDLADACLAVLERHHSPEPVNIGPGDDVSIRELAELIAKTTGFGGDIRFDTSQPEGAARRLLDSARLRSLGWTPQIDLSTGLATTYSWFAEHWPNVRH